MHSDTRYDTGIFWYKFGNPNFNRWWVDKIICVNFKFKFLLDIDYQGHSNSKIIAILSKVFWVSGSHLMNLDWTGDELSSAQANDHSRTVMHARIAYLHFPVPSVAGKTFPAFPVHARPGFYVAGKRPMGRHIFSFHRWFFRGMPSTVRDP